MTIKEVMAMRKQGAAVYEIFDAAQLGESIESSADCTASCPFYDLCRDHASQGHGYTCIDIFKVGIAQEELKEGFSAEWACNPAVQQFVELLRSGGSFAVTVDKGEITKVYES